MKRTLAFLTLLAAACASAPPAPQGKQYVYVLRPARIEMVTAGPNERELPALRAHVAYLEKLTRDGKLLVAGRTQNNDPETIGLAIFVAANDEEAAAIMNADPAVSSGVMTAKVYPYQIAFGRYAKP